MKKLTVLVAVVALFAFAVPALAANPFMDVPMNSWAYDAVSQLASQGVISGYPDGTFKGNQPMTRYEMASIVARALAVVDMNKASKQDVEMLKRLVVEFKDELDALGVDVAGLDERVAVLEENLGGWKMGADFRFDYTMIDDPTTGVYKGATDAWDDQDNTLSRARMHFWKTVNDKVKFYARINGEDPEFMRYRLTIDMPYESTLTVGKFFWDWESHLYFVSPPGSWQTDAVFSDSTIKGFHVAKDFAMGQVRVVAGRNDADVPEDEFLRYGVDFDFNVNEMFGMQVGYLAHDFEMGEDLSIMYGSPKVDFGNGMEFTGAYYKEDFESGFGDDPAMWKAIFKVDQEVTGFSSFWLEYAVADEGFYFPVQGVYSFVAGVPVDWDGVLPVETKVMQIMGTQQWNDKWDTWFRYAKFDFDTVDADVTNYTVGVDYLYTDSVRFELLYDKFDGDDFGLDDNKINFRTAIYF